MCFGISYLLNFNYIYGHFYRHGTFLLDVGWLAYLVEQNPSLTNPPAIGGGSYYSTHMSPILSLFSMVSFIADLPSGLWFGILIGLTYGGLCLGVFLFLTLVLELNGDWGILASLLLSGLFLWVGPVVSSIGYPHHEPLTCTFFIFFMLFLFLGRERWAWVAFTLCLMVREDSGFHVFAVLTMLLICQTFLKSFGCLPRRSIFIFAATALCWSLLALFFQSIFFPAGDTFHRIYIGNPQFAHLSWETIADRIGGFLVHRRDLYLPFLVLVVYSIKRRKWVYPAGYLAFAPWFLLNFAAATPAAGGLSLYYGFPFIISLFWPLSVLASESRGGVVEAPLLKKRLSLFLLFLLCGVAKPPLLRMR